MKHTHLDMHSDLCINRQYGHGFVNCCSYTPVKFLFFCGTKFFFISYHRCMAIGTDSDRDFKIMLINKVIGKYKIFKIHEVNKSIWVDEELKKQRIKGIALRKWIEQINFIYRDNACRPYAITTKTNFLDTICNQEEIMRNYLIAKEFLEKDKRENEFLLNELQDLYEYNNLGYIDPIECYKTIDSLINEINKTIKQ